MKKLITLFFLVQSVLVFSQVQDSLVWRYADVKCMLGGFTSKTKIEIDFGEVVQGWGRPVNLLKDATGNDMKFKSAVDALNWMSINGWELVQAYQAPASPGVNDFTYQHFIMRRKEVYNPGK